MKKRNKSVLANPFFFCLIAAIFLACLLFQGSFLPYVGYNAWNFNTYSLIAHNYLAFGYLDTKFAPIISVSQFLPTHPEYYLNHPPLLSILQSVFIALFSESFFSGRLPNIIASFSSLVLLSLLARKLLNREYAYIVFITGSLVPATVLFGRMIGQESILLFFILLVSYCSALYQEKKNKLFLMLVFFASFLGTLTDWPMVYFTTIFSVYLFSRRSYLLIVASLGVSLATCGGYLLYSSLIVGGLSFLLSGFLNRSMGMLLQEPFWYLAWVSTLVTRLIFYFNPVFVLISFYYFFVKSRGKSSGGGLLLAFLFFGIVHIALYPEGSFGHPYWMYYLLPFIVLSSSLLLYAFLIKKQYILLLVLIIFSIAYTITLSTWKTKEIEGNTFRFELAKIASSQLIPYQQIAVNQSGAIDPDIFGYSFHIPATRILPNKIQDISKFKSIVYTCLGKCTNDDKVFSFLQLQFSSTQFEGKGIEMWVFSNSNKNSVQSNIKHSIAISPPMNKETFLKKLHRVFLQYSSAAQL